MSDLAGSSPFDLRFPRTMRVLHRDAETSFDVRDLRCEQTCRSREESCFIHPNLKEFHIETWRNGEHTRLHTDHHLKPRVLMRLWVYTIGPGYADLQFHTCGSCK